MKAHMYWETWAVHISIYCHALSSVERLCPCRKREGGIKLITVCLPGQFCVSKATTRTSCQIRWWWMVMEEGEGQVPWPPWETERVWPIRMRTRSSTESRGIEEGEGAPRNASPIQMGSSQDQNQSTYHHVSCPFLLIICQLNFYL